MRITTIGWNPAWKGPLADKTLSLRYLGINGFEFSYAGHTLLIDPYVSRTKAEEPCSDPQIVRKYIRDADTVFLSHSHWDHLADVPEIVRQTDAAVYGSRTSCNSLRSCSVPEGNLIEFTSNQTYSCGPFLVTPIRSLHKQPCLYPGFYDGTPERSLMMRSDFLEGGTWALLITVGYKRFLILGSANFIAREMAGIVVDYLIVSIAGRPPDFMESLYETVSFQYCIPSHFDYFDTPLEDAGIRISIDEFEKELCGIDPSISIIIPTALDTLHLHI